MTWPVDVLVAVPARDEEERILACLTSIAVAADHAHRSGQVRRVRLCIGAHRCTDSTADIARSFFAERPKLHGLVHLDLASSSVGAVRRTLICAALQEPWHDDPTRTWIFNTDADSSVPPDWIDSSLRQARGVGAVAAVGLVRLESWNANDAAQLEYENLIAAGIRPDGHDHVYGANLAVRLDAYLAAGGFESIDCGEDHALVNQLHRRGLPTRATFEPLVATAGRMPGRVAHGLGGFLLSLANNTSGTRSSEGTRAAP